MDTINTNQIEIGGKLLNIEPKKLNGNVQINLTGDVSGSIDTPIEAGKTITIETRVEGGTGGGIPEAPIDDKQYARKNAGWVEVEGGGGEPEIFKIIPGIEDLGIDPTPFTDILEASRAGKYLVVECGIEGIYILNGTVTNFNYDEDDQTGGLQCVVSMEAPEYYMTPVKYICDLAYDASAATTDTWTVSEPLNIMSPSSTSRDGMVPTLQTLYEDRKVISWKLPTVVEVENLSTTPYTDVANIMAHGSSPVYWELGTLYLYLGIGTVDSATGYVFGSIRQEDDGTLYMQKRVAKSDETWYAPSTHFPIGGGGGTDNTFVVTPGAIAALTATPTPFTDIKTAFQASKVIQAHAIVNGEGVYGYLQAFQFNSTTNKGTAVFAFYNSNPDYLNGTDFIITCSYDASASPTDTWEQNIQMPIPAPAASDANKVLKANSSGNAVVWDKVKSSELTNDAGFLTDAPADGKQYCRKDNAWAEVIGGGSEGGAWEEIWKNEGNTNPTTITLEKKFSDYDFILVCGKNVTGISGKCFHESLLVPSSKITSTSVLGAYDDASYVWYYTDGINTLNFFTNRYLVVDSIYGINLKGSKKDESISFKQGLYGGYERENTPSLPSGYTKKYAIKNSGCSLLDTGLVFGDVNDWCLATSLGSHITGATYDCLMSNDYSNESTNMVRIITYYTNSSLLYNSDSTAGSTGTGTWWKDGVITMGRNRGTRFAKIDFNTNVLGNNRDGISNTSTFKLWSNTNANTVAEIKFFCAEINREKVADYVACIRNSDNCPGFYDFVSGTFKTSAAGGSDLIAVD